MSRLRRAWQRFGDLVVTIAVYLRLVRWPEDRSQSGHKRQHPHDTER